MVDPPAPSLRRDRRARARIRVGTRAGAHAGEQDDAIVSRFGVRRGRRGRRGEELIRRVDAGQHDDERVHGRLGRLGRVGAEDLDPDEHEPDDDGLDAVEPDDGLDDGLDDDVGAGDAGGGTGAPAEARWARRRPGRERRDAPRVVWRIGAAAAVVLVVIAVVLVVRALIVPATTRISLTPVSIPPTPSATTPEAGPETGDVAGVSTAAPATGRATGPTSTGGGGDASVPAATASTGVAGGVVVHVAGAVRRPGVVRLPAGSRVADALTAAGGALPGARVDAVNLAAPAQDGTQIRVPSAEEEVVAGPSVPGSGEPGATGSGSGSSGSTGGDAATGSGGNSAGSSGAAPPVDLNTADATALDALPRVGPVMAQRIVAWRTEHGPFGSVDDLDAVPGIGEKMMTELRPLVTTG